MPSSTSSSSSSSSNSSSSSSDTSGPDLRDHDTDRDKNGNGGEQHSDHLDKPATPEPNFSLDQDDDMVEDDNVQSPLKGGQELIADPAVIKMELDGENNQGSDYDSEIEPPQFSPVTEEREQGQDAVKVEDCDMEVLAAPATPTPICEHVTDQNEELAEVKVKVEVVEEEAAEVSSPLPGDEEPAPPKLSKNYPHIKEERTSLKREREPDPTFDKKGRSLRAKRESHNDERDTLFVDLDGFGDENDLTVYLQRSYPTSEAISGIKRLGRILQVELPLPVIKKIKKEHRDSSSSSSSGSSRSSSSSSISVSASESEDSSSSYHDSDSKSRQSKSKPVRKRRRSVSPDIIGGRGGRTIKKLAKLDKGKSRFFFPESKSKPVKKSSTTSVLKHKNKSSSYSRTVSSKDRNSGSRDRDHKSKSSLHKRDEKSPSKVSSHSSKSGSRSRSSSKDRHRSSSSSHKRSSGSSSSNSRYKSSSGSNSSSHRPSREQVVREVVESLLSKVELLIDGKSSKKSSSTSTSHSSSSSSSKKPHSSSSDRDKNKGSSSHREKSSSRTEERKSSSSSSGRAPSTEEREREPLARDKIKTERGSTSSSNAFEVKRDREKQQIIARRPLIMRPKKEVVEEEDKFLQSKRVMDKLALKLKGGPSSTPVKHEELYLSPSSSAAGAGVPLIIKSFKIPKKKDPEKAKLVKFTPILKSTPGEYVPKDDAGDELRAEGERKVRFTVPEGHREEHPKKKRKDVEKDRPRKLVLDPNLVQKELKDKDKKKIQEADLLFFPDTLTKDGAGTPPTTPPPMSPSVSNPTLTDSSSSCKDDEEIIEETPLTNLTCTLSPPPPAQLEPGQVPDTPEPPPPVQEVKSEPPPPLLQRQEQKPEPEKLAEPIELQPQPKINDDALPSLGQLDDNLDFDMDSSASSSYYAPISLANLPPLSRGRDREAGIRIRRDRSPTNAPSPFNFDRSHTDRDRDRTSSLSRRPSKSDDRNYGSGSRNRERPSSRPVAIYPQVVRPGQQQSQQNSDHPRSEKRYPPTPPPAPSLSPNLRTKAAVKDFGAGRGKSPDRSRVENGGYRDRERDQDRF